MFINDRVNFRLECFFHTNKLFPALIYKGYQDVLQSVQNKKIGRPYPEGTTMWRGLSNFLDVTRSRKVIEKNLSGQPYPEGTTMWRLAHYFCSSQSPL